ncbi:aspartyl/asparaginyl beta-hydroxylase domain-containing protein [Sandarakinorhabdus limnophila]|uniref:aspartyl/asparaginyl beta-hydroxylase domain-containing protein n=1 Tax=Sandarakinorhabdus limnophila TaxID=210512 RepID=UPI0026E9C3D4|nr:aspartyl/asparaginyl beta-hydroxylase domain-containing protein [Sandarakinorhabdus limnophila]
MNDPEKAALERTAQAGIAALQAGDGKTARRAFETIVASGRATLQIWLWLAQACDMLDDRAAVMAHVARVVELDAANPYALVMAGEVQTRSGNDRAAIAWYERALNAAQGRQLPPDLIARLNRAAAAREAAFAQFEAEMRGAFDTAGVDAASTGPRFAEALQIVSGRSQPYLQQPTSFYYPRLPQIPFYDPADFAWTGALAAALPAIRAEAEAVMAHGDGIAPYVEADPDRPNKGHALLADARWSAFHLFRNGLPIADHAARCPATMAALAQAPLPRIAGTAPMALFSILAPHTHIPPHNGMLNTRLICHLPLIVPDGCRLRVGAETRDVRAGEVLLFDDSIEHEAWNDSDAPRAILLFEVWRPELTAAERQALTVLFETVAAYTPDQA